LGLVRFHAAEWHIDPHKIGVLGFSSGGHLSAAISAHFEKRLYPTVDSADMNEVIRYRVVKDFIGLVTPSLLPVESIDSTL
jgi:hypothetical protein